MDPTGLPVESVVDEVRSALEASGVAVLVAPPGSGKTTVIPIRLLDTVAGRILVLEPRRLAARAAARRMAHLLGEPVGATVGFVTRHDRATSAATRIEVVTEGILTRRLQADPSLAGTGLVVFDEVHERNLQTDLGLALILDSRAGLRPDLHILVMSATIDSTNMGKFLGDAPVIAADARVHHVDLQWRPPPPRTRHVDEHVASVIRSALAEHEGDVLVFLPGMAEMRRVADRLTDSLADVRLLHGSLPVEEQDAAISAAEPPFRKVVLSTDIAESSLTVEGISVVVDSGLARSPRFDPRVGMTRLKTVPVSRASADQRAGRAGRLGPGTAYRLWSKMDHAARRPHIEPEITQVDLAGLALELAAWGVTDPSELAWLTPPPSAAWAEATALLEKLGALADGSVTDAGRAMARLPLHPRLARMIVDAGPDAGLAVWLATLIDERDPLRGHPDDLPVDIGVRLRLLTDGSYHHPAMVVGALRHLREVAAVLAHRAGVGDLADIAIDRAGCVLALAFPDRLAIRRGTPGRFQLRTGPTAVIGPADTLAAEAFVVAANLDGRRKDARIRLAAGISEKDVIERFSHDVEDARRLRWIDGRLVDRTEIRLGGIVLQTVDRRPQPSEETTAALVKRVVDEGTQVLPWTGGALELRRRVGHLRDALGAQWPDWSDSELRSSAAHWLGPHLVAATGWDDVQRLDMTSVLRGSLDHHLFEQLGRLAPTHVVVPSGRRVRVDYSGELPKAAVRVQEMFGSTETPTAGGRPVVLELLSPANRPVQVTSDLAGFWEGSWAEVRKEMAGRYPKHDWPEDPAQARPR